MRALLLTSAVPAATGNGLAMRAYAALEALAQVATVDVEVFGDIAAPDTQVRLLADEWTTRQYANGVEAVDALAWLSDPTWRAWASALLPLPSGALAVPPPVGVEWDRDRPRYDVIVVLRLRTVLAAMDLLSQQSPGVRYVLDLDDDEVVTHRALAELAAVRGEHSLAQQYARDADAYERMLGLVAPWFDQLVVAGETSRTDTVTVANQLPTAVADPTVGWDRRRPSSGEALRILFVGNLTYLPNADAAERLVERYAPAIAARLGRAVDVCLVGRAGPRLGALSKTRSTSAVSVSLLGQVDDLAAVYEAAHVVLLPLRAGGGSRIKVLEAFAHKMPVVASTTAVDGLAVSSLHCWLAEDADSAARAVGQVLDDVQATSTRIEQAARWVIRRHGADTVGQQWMMAFSPESAVGNPGD